MTEETPILKALADELVQTIFELGAKEATAAALSALRDAYELGAMSKPEPTPAPRTAFGQPANPDQQAGFVARAVHTIPAEKIAEHGEDALLAFMRQTMRELAQTGADPFRDMTIQVVGMPDGASIVAGEGRV